MSVLLIHILQDGRTVLHLAAQSGRMDWAKVLLGHGADVAAVDKVRADGPECMMNSPSGCALHLGLELMA